MRITRSEVDFAVWGMLGLTMISAVFGAYSIATLLLILAVGLGQFNEQQ